MSHLQQILQAAISMPAAPWSGLLALVALYWVVSLFSGLSADAFDALDGAEALADAADALDGDGGGDGGENRPGFMEKAGFGELPRSFTWSLITVFGWLFSVAGTVYVPGFRELALRGLGIAMMLGAASLALAIVATALAIQPVRQVLNHASGTERLELVGRVCTVKTGRVDTSFGQAEVDDGSMLVQVRNPGEHVFAMGTRALIYEYDPQQEVFLITPHAG